MPQPRDILDDTMPAEITALCETYDVNVLDYEDGPMPSAQLAPVDWSNVVKAAYGAGNLRALRVQIGSVWAVASIDFGDYCVSITTAPDPTRPLVLVDMVGM